jgi:hypothetical protein
MHRGESDQELYADMHKCSGRVRGYIPAETRTVMKFIGAMEEARRGRVGRRMGGKGTARTEVRDEEGRERVEP